MLRPTVCGLRTTYGFIALIAATYISIHVLSYDPADAFGRATNFDYTSNRPSMDCYDPQDIPGGIVFTGYAYSIDVLSRTAHILWVMDSCYPPPSIPGQDMPTVPNTDYNHLSCLPPDVILDFYFDAQSDIAASYYPPNGTFIMNMGQYSDGDRGRTTVMENITSGLQFRREHMLSVLSHSSYLVSDWGTDVYSYPYDRYRMETFIEARDRIADRSLPVIRGNIVDATGNFVVVPNCYGSGGWYTWDPSRRNASEISGNIVRQTKIVVFAKTLFAINWIITVAVLVVTLLAHLGIVKAEKTLLVLPASVILVLPGLRALWVGAPPYGTKLDDQGISIQMVLLAVALVDLIGLVALEAFMLKMPRKPRAKKMSRKPRADIESSPGGAEKAETIVALSTGAAGPDLPNLMAGTLKDAADQPVRRTTWS